MAVLYYRDPADNQWKAISNIPGPTGPTGPTGPAGTTQEVQVGTVAPTNPAILLWIDEGTNYP